MENPVEEDKKKEALAKELALLTLQDVGINKAVGILAQKFDLSLTRGKVAALKRHPSYNEVLQKGVQAMVEAGQLDFKIGTANLTPMALACLKKGLKKGDMQAVVQWAKAMGLDTKDSGPKQETGIQIILPGERKEKVIDIKPIKKGGSDE